MTAVPNLSRMQKYRRVFALLALEVPFVKSGDPVRLVLREPSADRCDLCLQIVNASGRVEAQRSLEVDGSTREISMGSVLSAGNHVLVVSPPLDQLHGVVPVSLRLPFSVGSGGGIARRRAEVLLREAAPEGCSGAVDLLLMALWSKRIGGELPDMSAGTGSGFVGGTCALLSGETAPDLDSLLCRFGTDGFGLSAPELERDVTALSALVMLAPPRTADLAAAVLDKLAFCLALGNASLSDELESDAKVILDALRNLLFFRTPSAGSAAVQALALATDYAPPDMLSEIASDPSPDSCQWHRRPGRHIRSAPCSMDTGDPVMRVEAGGQILELDFTTRHGMEGRSR